MRYASSLYIFVDSKLIVRSTYCACIPSYHIWCLMVYDACDNSKVVVSSSHIHDRRELKSHLSTSDQIQSIFFGRPKAICALFFDGNYYFDIELRHSQSISILICGYTDVASLSSGKDGRILSIGDERLLLLLLFVIGIRVKLKWNWNDVRSIFTKREKSLFCGFFFSIYFVVSISSSVRRNCTFRLLGRRSSTQTM